jgi:4-azaleucine resistance transporter AzlC
MFYVTLLDQCYWIGGTLIGAAAGSLIPFNTRGIGFSLTALFIVLMIEQIRRAGKGSGETGGEKAPKNAAWTAPFIISALAAVGTVVFLPPRISLAAALVLSLVLVQLFGKKRRRVW